MPKTDIAPVGPELPNKPVTPAPGEPGILVDNPQQRFLTNKLADIESRKVNNVQMAHGEQIYAISGPGPQARRVIKRDENGVIVFDKVGVYSREGTKDFAGLIAWMTNKPLPDMPKHGFPAESPEGGKAEIEFRDQRGWVSAYDGKLNTEAAIDL